MAAYLMPYLQSNNLQIISELTPTEYDAARKIFPGFIKNFQVIEIKEPSKTKVLEIIDHLVVYIKRDFKIEMEKSTSNLIYNLLHTFIPYESFPGKFSRFINSCLKKVVSEKLDAIDRNLVIRLFSEQTGLPEVLLLDDVPLRNSELLAFFKAVIKGQDHAIENLCSVIKIYKTGLNDTGKPIANIIFTGPTGVGKTATAKALANYFFNAGQKQEPLIRLDMSEYQSTEQIERLTGASGKLIQMVRSKPFCVILFDEIEKAHSSFFDVLLNILDEGRLVDSLGRLTDFHNSIIIMTTNLGAQHRSSIGFVSADDNRYDSSIRSFFRPEFYNRIDMVITFKSLDKNIIREIAIKELQELQLRQGIRRKNLILEFTPALIDYIVENGFDERYGARPLQREIERSIVAPLGKIMLNETIVNTILTIDYKESQVVITENI
jgi:ATP-dependent Clp protease ATP-binding subunit ClpA